MGAGSLSEFLDFMPETVQINPYASTSLSGVVSYSGVLASYPARIEMKNRLAVDKDGRTVVSRGRVFLGTTTLPDIKDLLILPLQYTPNMPPVISVNPTYDESGIHHITIEIG